MQPQTSADQPLARLNRQYIGHEFAPFSVPVEASRLRFFAKAIGQTDAVYTDESAARAAGHMGLPVPPTYLFCLEMDGPNPGSLRDLLDIDIGRVLHGEQHFTYRSACHAGDVLCFEQRIADIYAKKGGALEFVLRETRVSNQHGQHVADLKCVTVVRNT